MQICVDGTPEQLAVFAAAEAVRAPLDEDSDIARAAGALCLECPNLEACQALPDAWLYDPDAVELPRPRLEDMRNSVIGAHVLYVEFGSRTTAEIDPSSVVIDRSSLQININGGYDKKAREAAGPLAAVYDYILTGNITDDLKELLFQCAMHIAENKATSKSGVYDDPLLSITNAVIGRQGHGADDEITRRLEEINRIRRGGFASTLLGERPRIEYISHPGSSAKHVNWGAAQMRKDQEAVAEKGLCQLPENEVTFMCIGRTREATLNPQALCMQCPVFDLCGPVTVINGQVNKVSAGLRPNDLRALNARVNPTSSRNALMSPDFANIHEAVTKVFLKQRDSALKSGNTPEVALNVFGEKVVAQVTKIFVDKNLAKGEPRVKTPKK